MKRPRDIWAEALRSGHYNQCRGSLSDHGAYCVLGVACMCYEAETGEKLLRDRHGEYYACHLINEFSVVKEWLGLQHEYGRFFTEELFADCGVCSLVSLNDNEMLTFAELADIIESEPTGLFAS